MGMTPAGGLVMGTRPGYLDPGVILHLLDRGWDARAIERLVNHESGLLALSETTSDVRSLLGARTVDARAAFALEAFAYDARKWVGALAATLGGIDTLVFTGGVGEHAPLVRAEIVNGLGHLGMTLDEAANARHADVISAKGSACTVRVVATDEERVVARHAARILARA
jgi:acetate kinase